MDDHWLARPTTIKRLRAVSAAVLAATVLAEFWIANDPHFEVERLFAFSALYGFLSCAAMIIAAKALGWWLKRPETYYGERDSD